MDSITMGEKGSRRASIGGRFNHLPCHSFGMRRCVRSSRSRPPSLYLPSFLGPTPLFFVFFPSPSSYAHSIVPLTSSPRYLTPRTGPYSAPILFSRPASHQHALTLTW